MSSAEVLFSEFSVNQTTGTPENIFAKFVVNQTNASIDLFTDLLIRQSAAVNLFAKFEVGQGSSDLLAFFRVTQEQLFSEFFVAKTRGRIDEENISTWGTSAIATPGFADTAIERIRRPQGAVPKWILFQTSEGEVKVYDSSGVAYPQHDLDLAYDPDEIYINNLDPPHIAIKSGTIIYVYRNGSELFNTGAITNLRYHNISNGYLHTSVYGAGNGLEWRSLVDGSIITTLAVVMFEINIWGPWVSEDGEDVYYGYRDTSGSRYGWLRKANRLLGDGWRYRFQTGGSASQVRCSGDASLVVARLSGGGIAEANVYDNYGNELNSYSPWVNFSLGLDVSPTASHAAWTRLGTTTARVIDCFGNYSDITLPAASIYNLDSVTCLPGGYTAFACNNGSIYLYDLDGNLKDTITGADTATVLTWVFDGLLPSFEDLKATFYLPLNLFAKFDVGQGSEHIFAELIVRHSASEDLFSKFIVRQTDDQDLFAKFIIRHADSENLYAKLLLRQETEDLFTKFGVLNYPRTIGPSTVATADGVLIPIRTWRGVFYAHGRHFVVWGESDGLYYRHSDDDGASWSADVLLRANIKYAYWCSIHFDGVYLHYAFCDSTGFGTAMYYRRGRIESNGSITWSAAEQTAVSGWANHSYREMSVSVDSDGYPFISYLVFSFGTDQYPTVTKSTENDGTWVTETGYPLTLDPTSNGNWRTQIVSLGANRMYAMWGIYGTAYGKAYDGANWSAKETITEPVNRVFQLTPLPNSAVIVSYNGAGGDVRMKIRTWGIGWGAESTIWNCNDSSIDHTLVARGSTLWAFFCTAYSTAQPSYVDWVAYLTSTDGGTTWINKSGGSTPNFWIDETTDGFSQIYTFTSAYKQWAGVVGIAYQTDGPTKARYAALRYWEEANLHGFFHVGQDSIDLKAEFHVGQNSEELFTKFTVRHIGTEDLFAKFVVQAAIWSEDLFAKFEIRHSAEEDLFCKFTIRYSATEELFSKFIVRQETYRELFSKFIVRQEVSQNLFSKIFIGWDASEDLFSKFVIRQTATQELFAEAIIRQAATQNLKAIFEVGQDSVGLFAEFKLSTIEISLREHGDRTGGAVQWVWSKPSASVMRGANTLAGYWGTARNFFVISKSYIHGKYIRIRWRADYTWATWVTAVYVYDGAYERGSQVDFPDGFPMLLKGNGLLQTGLSHSGDFAWVTEEFQVDVRGGAIAAASEDNVTIFISSHDAWSAQTGWFEIDFLEINDGAAGANREWYEPFNDSVHMEITGTYHDQGYISDGFPLREGSGNVFAKFEVGQGSEDLFAKFIIRHSATKDLFAKFEIQDSEALFADFIVRQEATGDLFSEFTIRHSATEDLFAEFTVSQPGSADLFAEFIVKQTDTTDLFSKVTIRQTATVDLYSEFIVRQADTTDLFTKSIIRHLASQDFFSEFIIRQTGTADLFSEFIVRQPASLNLFSKFIVRHEASQDIFAKLIIQHSATEDLYADFTVRQAITEDLFSKLTIRQSAYQELFAKLDVKSEWTFEIFSEFIVRHTDTRDLFSEFIARQTGFAELFAEFEVKHSASIDLFSKTTIRHTDTQELFAKLIIRQSETRDLFTKFTIRRTSFQDLSAEFILRQPGTSDLFSKLLIQQITSVDLPARFTVRHTDYRELYARFTVQPFYDLFAKAIIRHPATSDLFAQFSVFNAGSQDLLAEFRVKPAEQSIDLFAFFLLRESFFSELWGEFSVRQLETRADDFEILPRRQFNLGLQPGVEGGPPLERFVPGPPKILRAEKTTAGVKKKYVKVRRRR